MWIQLTGIPDESWLDIYHNISDRHLHGKRRNNHDCVHGLVDDSTDAVVSLMPAAMFLDCLADESMPGSTVKQRQPCELVRITLCVRMTARTETNKTCDFVSYFRATYVILLNFLRLLTGINPPDEFKS